MLFLVLLVEGLLIAVAAYVVGAIIALGGWVVSLILPFLKIPAFLRWSGAVLTVLLIGIWGFPDVLNATHIQAEDWAQLASGTFRVCFGLAIGALIVTGVVISITKAVAKGVAKGVKVATSSE